jgi:hypothetical protein
MVNCKADLSNVFFIFFSCSVFRFPAITLDVVFHILKANKSLVTSRNTNKCQTIKRYRIPCNVNRRRPPYHSVSVYNTMFPKLTDG